MKIMKCMVMKEVGGWAKLLATAAAAAAAAAATLPASKGRNIPLPCNTAVIHGCGPPTCRPLFAPEVQF